MRRPIRTLPKVRWKRYPAWSEAAFLCDCQSTIDGAIAWWHALLSRFPIQFKHAPIYRSDVNLRILWAVGLYM